MLINRDHYWAWLYIGKTELQLETVDKGKKLLDKTDRMVELSRRPLTYIQEHVPFLTKRDIIFFGRLEFDGAMYSSGILESHSSKLF